MRQATTAKVRFHAVEAHVSALQPSALIACPSGKRCCLLLNSFKRAILASNPPGIWRMSVMAAARVADDSRNDIVFGARIGELIAGVSEVSNSVMAQPYELERRAADRIATTIEGGEHGRF